MCTTEVKSQLVKSSSFNSKTKVAYNILGLLRPYGSALEEGAVEEQF